MKREILLLIYIFNGFSVFFKAIERNQRSLRKPNVSSLLMRSGELAYTPHLLHSLILYAISYVPCYMLTYLKCFLSRVLWLYLPLLFGACQEKENSTVC